MRGRPSWLTSSADESANVIESRPCQGRGGTGSSAITGSRRSARCLAISGAFRAEVVLSPTSQWGAVGAAGGGTPSPTRSSWPTYRDVSETLPHERWAG
jgi:hypothetical protein